VRKSEYVLGRQPIRERLERDGVVTVAAVQCNAGSKDAWVMFMETQATGKQRKPVLYRIRVRLKPGAETRAKRPDPGTDTTDNGLQRPNAA
jgi:hypothetical protein